MSIKIGIDVGGTFTDAVAIDNDTLEIIGYTKVFTTYHSKLGVTSGIINAISKIISCHNIHPSDISLIATGTTQATNAILEGDVCDVGVIYIGSRFRKFRDVHLCNNKCIHVKTFTINNTPSFDADICDIFDRIVRLNIKSVVASCPFSPDNSLLEQKIISAANRYNIYATATNDISSLYGIKIRTNTAIINASIMPKMVDTFSMLKQSITSMGITAPIMVMRCDGGIMSIDEIKKRPFLTLMSGPAASVYGALVYEKISTGIFLEVGGTSTDISIIKNGQVMLTNPTIGGHRLYLNSLDINTIAIAGGSLIRITKQKIDIGPRSSHILGLPYSCFSSPDDLVGLSLSFVEYDGYQYATVTNNNGKTFSITLTCVLNALGLIQNDNYCFGNQQSAILALKPLALFFHTTVDDIAKRILDIAISKYSSILYHLVKIHKLDPSTIVLFGGGGACDPLVPLVAKKINAKSTICKNAPIISSIGICMSVLREVVERNILNPTAADIKNIKLAASQKLSKSLANQSSIQTQVEFDNTRHILRAIATGTINTTHLATSSSDPKDIISLYTGSQNTTHRLTIGNYSLFDVVVTRKIFLKMFSHDVTLLVVIDNYNIIRFSKSIRSYHVYSSTSLLDKLKISLDENSIYSDAGMLLPRLTIVTPSRILDLSSFADSKSILSFVECELNLKEFFDVVCLIE